MNYGDKPLPLKILLNFSNINSSYFDCYRLCVYSVGRDLTQLLKLLVVIVVETMFLLRKTIFINSQCYNKINVL